MKTALLRIRGIIIGILLVAVPTAFSAGTWNGAAITAWNGASITSWNGSGVSVGSSPTYLIVEGFEGSGYELGAPPWVEGGSGVKDEDYGTSAIVGSHSLQITATSQNPSTYIPFTAGVTRYFYFRMRADAWFGATRNICSIRDASGNTLGTVSQTSTPALRVQTTGGSTNTSTDALPTAGTNFHVWITYTEGGGANGTISAGWSTDGTVPASFPATGPKTCLSNNGTSLGQAARLYMGIGGTGDQNSVFDRVLIDDAPIGSNP